MYLVTIALFPLGIILRDGDGFFKPVAWLIKQLEFFLQVSFTYINLVFLVSISSVH